MNTRAVWIAVFVVLIIRFLTLNDYPLTDTTEARYGEVARVMAVTDHWIMPQLVPGEPFWAKPPLSFWQGSISVKILGVSELALRLPAFMNFIAVLLITFLFSRAFLPVHLGGLSVLIAASTVTGLVVSGSVMTDLAMLLGTTLCFYCFWMVLSGRGTHWAYLMTFGLVVALLAKGPIAIVLALGPIVVWLTMMKQWRQVWILFPFLNCVIMFIALGVPWFLIAEHNSPGYLHYYFVGEHLYRYLVPGWEGDMYGNAHQEPYGKIWVFAALAFMPWTIFLFVGAVQKIRTNCQTKQPLGGWSKSEYPLKIYLLLWIVWPLIFFTFAGNILHTYVLTGLPAFAILTALFIDKQFKHVAIASVAVILPISLLIALPLGLEAKLATKSQKASIEHVNAHWPEAKIIYVGSIPHSARYYSRGNVLFEPDIFNLKMRLVDSENQVIFVKKGVAFKEGTPLRPVEQLESRRFQGYVFDSSIGNRIATRATR